MYSTSDDFNLKSKNCMKKLIVNDEIKYVQAEVFDLIFESLELSYGKYFDFIKLKS